MFETVKLGGIWQIWNVTCDGSIVVENWHRNMGFFKSPTDEKVRAFISILKAIKPVLSLSTDFSKVVLNSDLKRHPKGFHVFDYVQIQEAGIDINAFLLVSDFRLGSFVVFKGNIFTPQRIVDELDTYPGRPWLKRHLRGQEPAPVEAKDVLEIVIPFRKDVKNNLLKAADESGCDDEQPDMHVLQGQVEHYIDTYCYPDLDLKIPSMLNSKCEGKL